MKEKIKDNIISLATKINPILGSKIFYYTKFHKKLNLKNPSTFNEKLMYLKLYNYNQNKKVWSCCDKYKVREYALNNQLTENNLPKLIKIYNNVEEIDFSKLPNKFVLKCSHGCGFNIICMDKSKIKEQEIKDKLKKWQHTKFGYKTAEIHYNHIKPVILCEEFIENENNKFPTDYKLYCFHGKVKVILICTDRENNYKTHFYDRNWNKIILRDNQDKEEIKKPNSLEEMITYAELLSKEFPFVRVDFYELKNTPILGEMTFTPAACVGNYNEEGEKYLSSFLNIKNIVGEKK